MSGRILSSKKSPSETRRGGGVVRAVTIRKLTWGWFFTPERHFPFVRLTRRNR
jgi:hypothetical protein